MHEGIPTVWGGYMLNRTATGVFLVVLAVIAGGCGLKKPSVVEQPPVAEQPVVPQPDPNAQVREEASRAIARAEIAVADADAAGARTLAAVKFQEAVAKLASATDRFSAGEYAVARDEAVIAETLAREAEAEARAAARRRADRPRASPKPTAVRTPPPAAPVQVAEPEPAPVPVPMPAPTPKDGTNPLAVVIVAAVLVGGGAALFVSLKPKVPRAQK